MNLKTLHILCLCTGNSARSILAEAMINQLQAGRFVGMSAGSDPAGAPNPYALELLKERGFDLSFARSKHWSEFAQPGAPSIDLLITVCDAAQQTCPVFPGNTYRLHWGLPDPAGLDGEAESRRAFEDTYAALEKRFEILRARLARTQLDQDVLSEIQHLVDLV